MSIPESLNHGRIAVMQERLAALQQQVSAAPAQTATLLSEALEDLRISLEELHVAEEELHAQNEELLTAHLTAETERQRYQELFDFAPDGYLVTDPLGIIKEVNQTVAALLAMRPHHVLGKPISIFVVRQAQPAFRSLLGRLQQLERVQEWETRIQPRDGGTFPAALTVAVMRNPQGTLVGLRWLLRDITARKQAEAALKQAQETLERRVAERTAELQCTNARLQAEIAERQRAADKAQQAEQALRSSREQLRQLATYLQNAQEQERTRIARELHDNLAQTLTSLRMDVSWLSRRVLSAPVAWRERLTTMATMIDALGESVRRIGTELRPTVLDNLGLVAAIEWQLKDVHDRTGLTYTLHAPAEELALGPVLSTTMFRIFQEALTNVVRHAQATRLTVRLAQHRDAWVLEIADNGKGITPDQLTDCTSLGLLGMRERARLWGGGGGD
jgi:PAS domain S-box-containing protein